MDSEESELNVMLEPYISLIYLRFSLNSYYENTKKPRSNARLFWFKLRLT